MSDFKWQMQERIDQGMSPDAAYADTRESYLGAADDLRTRAKEAGYRNPLVAPYFCQTCHWSDTAHPREECATGFIPGDPEKVRAWNRSIGWEF